MKEKINQIKEILSEALCISVEGSEFMPRHDVKDHVENSIGKAYQLCDEIIDQDKEE